MFGWEALLLVKKVEQDVLEAVMSPALVTQKLRLACATGCSSSMLRNLSAAAQFHACHRKQSYLWQLYFCAGLVEQA